jgi:hypothetical protein
MFLTAIARPTYRRSGKVGIWRITGPVTYVKKNRHGPAGTYEEDCSMTGERFRHYMINHVFPAARKMYRSESKIYIQMDNAPGHAAKETVRLLQEEGKRAYPHIEIIQQPACSPDTNLNDLGFYSSFDSKMPGTRGFKLDDIAATVIAAFWKYDTDLLERLCVCKTMICHEIIKCGGDNDYDMPHRDTFVPYDSDSSSDSDAPVDSEDSDD